LPIETRQKCSSVNLMDSTPDRTCNSNQSEFQLQRIYMLKISQHDTQSVLLSFDCFPTINEPEVPVLFICLRLGKRSIERAMDLTDSFTWEDMPTRDADTGHLTVAGWIPLTMKFSRSAFFVLLCFHTVQSSTRIVTNHETIFSAWYPFDWTVSPFYELVNISQVTIYKTKFLLSISLFFLY